MFYVYYLANEDDRTYIGFTSDLKARLRAHNDGVTRSTSGHRWRLVYYEAFAAKSDAQRRELQLKGSGQGRKWLRERLKDSFEQSKRKQVPGEALNRSPGKRRP